MFEKVFKFDPINFSEGTIAFQGGAGVVLYVLLLVGLLAGLVWTYRRADRYRSRRHRVGSFALRAVILLLLCLPLLEPVLIRPDVVPDENFVAVLVDGSESMNVPDGPGGATRREAVRRLLFEGGEAIAPGLEEVFKVRYYTFADEARRVDSAAAAAADGHGTNLSAALDRVLSDFRGVPLAGVVLLTDGGDNSTAVPLNRAEELRAREVPLYVVGVGEEEAEGERELLEVDVSRGVDATTGAEIAVKLRSWRREAEPVAIGLYDGDEQVHVERHVLKGEGKIDQVTLFYEPEGAEAREYVLRLEEAAGERNLENNAAELLIDPRRDTLRVLVVEGHPRREFKFTKRALEDDPAVVFTSILRTNTGTFYRQGIRAPGELAGGFPGTEEELFGFHAVLFGDVEASQFSIDQLSMIERFVRLRGGGFAMLGGRTSFAEGGYWDDPVADLLPVALDPSRRTVVPPSFGEEGGPEGEQGFPFRPTDAGLESPILRLAVDPSANRSQWTDMPAMTSINFLGAVKPGAAVLAEKPEDEFGSREPLLVVQRYGKGRSAALATASTWRWQMQLDAEDQRHERFWRQLVRWLAASAPDRVELSLPADRLAPGEEIQARVEVYDARHRPVEDAVLSGTLTDPGGAAREVDFRPELGTPGAYTATLLPGEEGLYVLEVSAEAEGAPVGTQARSILVRPTRKEYHDAVLKRAFLENLATAAGGAYFEPGDADAIPANLRGRRTSTSIFLVDPLWDMPFLFGLLLVLLSAEWIWRRRQGLP